MPNFLANAVLVLFPILAPFAYLAFRPALAVTLIFISGELLLPANHKIDLPLLPPLDKVSGPCLAAFMGAVFFARRHLRGARPFRGADFALLFFMVGALLTSLNNTDPIVVGKLTLRGEKPYDAVSTAIRVLINTWIPYYLGRALFKEIDDYVRFWRVLVGAAVIYTLPVLVELRMSPQFSNWFYGYSPSSWLQVIRDGGYRPMVFFNHGLSLAFFLMLSILMGMALARTRRRVLGLPAWPVYAYLLVILLLCKSAGAMIYAVFGSALLALFSPRRIVKWCGRIGVVVAIYPLLRLYDLLPLQQLVDAAGNYLGPARAESLAYRFNNESALLQHARERLWLGWGGFGRNFTYNLEMSKVDSVVDGHVVALLGSRGLLGYASMFALYLTPLWLLVRRFKHLVDPRERIFYAHVAVIATVFSADLIINATVIPYLLLMLGAIEGTSREFARAAQVAPPAPLDDISQVTSRPP